MTATPMAASARTGGPLRRRRLAALAIGNAVEFYDFTVYVFFAVPIGRAFFPADAPLTALLLSVAAFGVGFLTRPLGAVVMGAYADRRGRKPAMLLTISLMALGTLAIAAAPGRAVAGAVGPVLVVLARLVQGFAYGGETGPSTTALMEAAGPGRRATAVGWLTAAQGGAALAASLVGLGLSLLLPVPALDAWGWRVALALGLAVVPAGLAIRAAVPDEPGRDGRPVAALLHQASRGSLALPSAVLVIASSAVVFYALSFMTGYALTTLKLPPVSAFLATFAAGGVTLLLGPAGGWLADRIGRRNAQVLPRFALAALAMPGFWWLAESRSTVALVTVAGLLGGLNALAAPAGLCAIVEGMPSAARVTGLSLATAIGASVLGGFTPLVIAFLLSWTGDALSPAYCLVAASTLGLLAAYGLPNAASDMPSELSATAAPIPER